MFLAEGSDLTSKYMFTIFLSIYNLNSNMVALGCAVYLHFLCNKHFYLNVWLLVSIFDMSTQRQNVFLNVCNFINFNEHAIKFMNNLYKNRALVD